MERQPLQKRHGWSTHRKTWKEKNPDGLFEDAGKDAEWEEEKKDGLEICSIDAVSQSPPEDPAEKPPDEVLRAPRLKE
jgi:hypothetical protein